MADPAVEVAQRVWHAWTYTDASLKDLAEAAAREALKPIRELHKPEVVRSPDDEQWTECAVCYGSYWPCATARLIYSTEELAQ